MSHLIFLDQVKKMPGHVKKGGKQEQDPDPSPWLVLSFEMKKEDSLKPYDAKKSVWVPDGMLRFIKRFFNQLCIVQARVASMRR